MKSIIMAICFAVFVMFVLIPCLLKGGRKEEAKKAEYQSKADKEKYEALTEAEIRKIMDSGKFERNAIQYAFDGAVNGSKRDMYLFASCCHIHLKDMNKAFYWYKKAADAGDPDAMYWLANSFYGCGQVVKKDEQKALMLLMDAAGKGHKQSIEELLEMGMSKEEMRNCGIPV